MKKVFLTSDTHFGHLGVCKFMLDDGVTKLRPWDTPEEMDEALVANWNSVVSPTDKVYHLGDVLINRKAFPTLARLNGDKILIRGNHDIFPDEEYRYYFRELRAYHILSGVILSHIPVHSDSLGRFGTNIHGHTHAKRVMKPRGYDSKRGEIIYGDEFDVRYKCVCVEQTKFTPIELDVLFDEIRKEGGSVEKVNRH